MIDVAVATPAAPAAAPGRLSTTSIETKAAFCRTCTAMCPAYIDIENGRPVALKPIREHPVFHGYVCAKGLASPEIPYLPGRLLHSMRRAPDGSYQPIGSGQAVREIAAIIKKTIAEHGPRSVALYTGTWGSINLPSWRFGEAFMEAIGSPMVFNSMQIDQPGKPIASALHGTWLAGQANMDQADAMLVIGTNPAISMLGPPNPHHTIKRARKRGAKIYAIDPRHTELAHQADIFLQVPPGQDALILAGIIHIILAEKLEDATFLNENVNGFEALEQAVRPITPELIAQRTGVSIQDLRAVALGYAASKSGIVFAGTGPNMSPHGTLMEYLRLCLMTVCGHWRRAGDNISAHGVLVHLPPPIAQAVDPSPGWGLGETLRVRELTPTACGMPTSALAEEILLDGDGQVRVLIVNGGNPMMAWPDQMRTHDAMKKLDLLVCIEPVMSETARHADYVIAPRIQHETANTTALLELLWGWFPIAHPIEPYAAVSPVLVEPPAGADVMHDWRFFYDLAQATGTQLTLKPVSFIFNPPEAQARAIRLDMSTAPSIDEMWDLMLAGSPVPLSEVLAYPEGHIFQMPLCTVLPKIDGWEGRLEIGNADMMKDLERCFTDQANERSSEFPFKLIGRRLKDRYNSSWREQRVTRRRWHHNPAFMNPADMAKLSIVAGDLIEIRSRHGVIKGVAEAEPTLLRGVAAMTHAWGANPDENIDPLTDGANTGVLTDTSIDFDPFSAMPRMGAIPISIARTAWSERRDGAVYDRS